MIFILRFVLLELKYYSDTIPAAIRRAVTLRDKHCAWPGCDGTSEARSPDGRLVLHSHAPPTRRAGSFGAAGANPGAACGHY
jgi:hypothetical protein